MALQRKQMDRLITLSENHNTPKEHWKIITQLSTLEPKDASFIISKLEEKNEYGRPVNKLNSVKVRNTNVGISKDPMKYEKYSTEEEDAGKLTEQNWHRLKFQKAITAKEWDQAIIHYLTLKEMKDKAFLTGVQSKHEELPELWSALDAVTKKTEANGH